MDVFSTTRDALEGATNTIFLILDEFNYVEIPERVSNAALEAFQALRTVDFSQGLNYLISDLSEVFSSGNPVEVLILLYVINSIPEAAKSLRPILNSISSTEGIAGLILTPALMKAEVCATNILLGNSKRYLSFGRSQLNPIDRLMLPLNCIIAPVQVEIFFRGWMQEKVKESIHNKLITAGAPPQLAKSVAIVCSIALTSIAYGLYHLRCVVFMPLKYAVKQSVKATLAGICLGTAKEVSGGLNMPIAMHFANNVLANLACEFDFVY